MCTPSKWEGFGLVFVEAAACGAKIITSDVPPMNEYFSNGKFSSPEEIQIILNELIKRCEAFPDAVMEVDW